MIAWSLDALRASAAVRAIVVAGGIALAGAGAAWLYVAGFAAAC